MLYPEIRDLLAAYENDRTSGAGRYALGPTLANPGICRVDGDRDDPILVPLATFRGIIKDLCEEVDHQQRTIVDLKAQLASYRPTV